MVTGGLQKRGSTWYAVWRQDGRQRWKSTGKSNKAEARAELEAIVRPLNASDQARSFREAADAAYRRKGEAVGSSLRIDALWETFSTAPERPDAGPVTMKEYKRQLERFTGWLREEHPKLTSAADVTPGVASDFARWLSPQIGATTYNKNLSCLRLVWKTVGKRTGWQENPWSGVAMKRSHAISKRELTAEEICRLLEADTGEWRTLVQLGVFTALRLADCATLRWDEADLDAGLIRRVPRKTASRTGKTVVVPIHAALQRDLMALKATAKGPYVLPTLAPRYLRKHSSLEKHLGRMFRRAGIKTTSAEAPAGRVKRTAVAGFHSLRHSFVSICRSSGVAEAFVMSIVGHGSPAMTRHYTHIGEAAARSAIAALPDVGAPKPAMPAAAPETRPPLPEWALAELAAMDAHTWQDVRRRLTGHDQPTHQPPS